MTERLPDNLKVLYEGFTKEAIGAIFPGDAFTVDDVEFVCKYMPDSTAQRFFIVKPLKLVDQYRAICEEFRGGTIFELGIAEGGSTALFALLAKPRKIIAVDLEPQPLDALAEFAEAHGLSDVVRPYYGVDQSDAARLTEIVEAELGDAIAEVSVGEFTLVVRRGGAELDPETFRVADLFTDYFGFLPDNVQS